MSQLVYALLIFFGGSVLMILMFAGILLLALKLTRYVKAAMAKAHPKAHP